MKRCEGRIIMKEWSNKWLLKQAKKQGLSVGFVNIGDRHEDEKD